MSQKPKQSWVPWALLGVGIFVVIAVISTLSSGDDGDGGNPYPPIDWAATPERPVTPWKPPEPEVQLSDLECGYDEARGRITNNSNVTIEAFIDVQFLDSKGVVVDDSLGTIRGLRPGETGEWDAPYLGDGRYDNCRADISSVFSH